MRSPTRALRPLGGICFGVLVLAVGLTVGGCGSEAPEEMQSREMADSATSRVPRRAARLLQSARKAFGRHQYGRALDLIDRAEKIVPPGSDASPLHYTKGRVLMELRQYQEADSAFARAIEERPDYRGARFQLGHSKFRRSKYREALRYYREEERRFEVPPMVWYQIGRSYSRLGRPDSARKAFRQVLEVDTTFGRAHLRLAELARNRGDMKQALRQARKARAFRPKHTESRFTYAELLLETGRVETAVESLRAVVMSDSSHRPARYHLGRGLVRLGAEVEAKSHLAVAESLRAIEKRLERLRQRAHLNPEDPRHWLRLGRALRESGDRRGARRAFRIVRSLAPDTNALEDFSGSS